MNTHLAGLLADAGLAASVRCVLTGQQTRVAEQLRERAHRRWPRPGVHGLVVRRDPWGQTIAVPLMPHTASVDARDAASTAAAKHAASVLSRERMPGFAFDLDYLLDIKGGSAGLAIYLSLLDWGSEQALLLPTFATGVIGQAHSGVAAVAHLETKVRAALADLRDQDGIILVPAEGALPSELKDPRIRPVATLDQAREVAFGVSRLSAAPARFDLHTRLSDIENMGDHAEALKELDALLADCPFPEDRLGIELRRGMRLRHLGRAREAERVHGEALQQARGTVDAATSERMEIEHYNSGLDLFESMEDIVAFFADRVERDFVLTQNQLYAGGIYSRALGMMGRFEEALAQRKRVLELELHERSALLAAEAAQSYCELLLCHALAVRREGLEAVVTELIRATQASRDRDGQQRYNVASLLRSAVAFDAVEEGLRWVRGEQALFGAAPITQATFLFGTARIHGHPQVTIARSYARLLRRAGRHDEACAVLERLAPNVGFVGWLVEAGRVEHALMLHDLTEAAAPTVRDVALARMREVHAGATRRYFPDARPSWSQLQRAIDSIWY